MIFPLWKQCLPFKAVIFCGAPGLLTGACITVLVFMISFFQQELIILAISCLALVTFNIWDGSSHGIDLALHLESGTQQARLTGLYSERREPASLVQLQVARLKVSGFFLNGFSVKIPEIRYVADKSLRYFHVLFHKYPHI